MKSSKPEVRSQKSEINLHIEELVLHGFAPGDRHRISEAVQQELTRLISEQSGFASASKNITRDHVDGGNFRMTNAAKTTVVGTQIAGAIWGGISQ
jgi:hypothetical protein